MIIDPRWALLHMVLDHHPHSHVVTHDRPKADSHPQWQLYPRLSRSAHKTVDLGLVGTRPPWRADTCRFSGHSWVFIGHVETSFGHERPHSIGPRGNQASNGNMTPLSCTAPSTLSRLGPRTSSNFQIQTIIVRHNILKHAASRTLPAPQTSACGSAAGVGASPEPSLTQHASNGFQVGCVTSPENAMPSTVYSPTRVQSRPVWLKVLRLGWCHLWTEAGARRTVRAENHERTGGGKGDVASLALDHLEATNCDVLRDCRVGNLGLSQFDHRPPDLKEVLSTFRKLTHSFAQSS